MSNCSRENIMKPVTNAKPTATVTNVKPESEPVPVTNAEVQVLTTSHLAKKFQMKPTQLRRILRSMPRYNDSVHTNYAWAGWGDPAIKEIEAKIHARAVAAADKAIEAKDATATVTNPPVAKLA